MKKKKNTPSFSVCVFCVFVCCTLTRKFFRLRLSQLAMEVGACPENGKKRKKERQKKMKEKKGQQCGVEDISFIKFFSLPSPCHGG